MSKLPEGFLWGASTSGHQVEGDNSSSDWWRMENTGALQERSGDAVDHYHRYPEDMRLLADAGLNAYRFSIEWARIEPEPGLISKAQLRHYRRMIDTAIEAGLTPVVTLHHFASPYWFAEAGGWLADDALDRFRSYVETVSAILDGVAWVCTINEPNILALMSRMRDASALGNGPTMAQDALFVPDTAIGERLVQAHHVARAILRERTSAKVGWTIAQQAFTETPGNEEVFRKVTWAWEDLYLEASREDDFVGVQSYTSQPVDANGPVPHPSSPDNTLTGWAYRPDALGMALRHAHEVTGKPLLVTENGIATTDDERRIAYTREALRHLVAAVEDGIDVRGYLHWSALDNYEWGHWAPTFGLIAVDRDTFERHPKPSLAWLGHTAATGAAELPEGTTSFEPDPADPPAPGTGGALSRDSRLGDILDDDHGRAVLEAYVPELIGNPQLALARGMSLASIAGFAGDALGDDVLDRIDRDLRTGDCGPRTRRSKDGRREAPEATGQEAPQERPHEEPDTAAGADTGPVPPAAPDGTVRAKDLTLAEKTSLTSGADFWTTKAVERAGIPSITMTDGPHGLRKQAGATDHLGLAESVPATCFPPAVGLASSFDPELARRVGEALGTESAVEDVAVILGPGINIKRSPLCGRNFEYFSEDPLVSGVLGAGLVRGIQSKGVGSSLKHFAANNQEHDRMRASSDIDPRPLREIYLRGFQRVVKDAQPWTVMCSYNRVNGVYASQNPWLLTEVLREEWGFEGLVVSDWGAVDDRVKGLAAGLDLEMPSSGGRTDAQLAAAVEDGSLDERAVDVAADRVLDLVRKAQERPAADGPLDVDAHHALAREVAGRSIVLLKNDGLLPLARRTRVAVIGAFAEQPRYQGAGSSLINPTRLETALEEIRALSTGEVSYAAGFTTDGSGNATALREEAVTAAGAAQVAVLFLGLPAAQESEGFDREHINLPTAQLELLDAVVAANPNTVVVLSNGGVVALPFRDRVPAIMEGWLLGQAGGGATADVLYGVVNPSGKLTETIPLSLEDNPSYGNFPGESGHVRYGEGLLVGYRWYDAKGLDVTYPFGHGLSYTTFSYGEAAASVNDRGDVVVTVPVTNTGEVSGREVVQVYTSLAHSAVQRAPRELKAFASVALEAGETRTVELTVRRTDLTYWDVRVDRWVLEEGDYTIEVGASSRDLRTTATVTLQGDVVELPLTMESSIADLMAHPVVGPIVQQAMADGLGSSLDDAAAVIPSEEGLQKMLASFPIGRLAGFPGVPITYEQIQGLVAMGNARQ